MGERGPLKKLTLVDGKFKPPANIPRPKPKLPICPAWLSKEAKAEWRRVARPLYDIGLLTELDRQTLAVYCECWARYLRAERVLAAEGVTFVTPTGLLKQRPEYFIMRDSLQELQRLVKLFGLSPSARMRMEIPEQQDPDELEDLLD